jgi:phenylacetate-CoA ligase
MTSRHARQDCSDEAIPYYWKSLDWEALTRDYPPPPAFGKTTGRMSADALRDMQNTRFLERMKDAWNTGFYRSRWEAAGLAPEDIRSLDDIEKIPTFNSDDLKDAIAARPPFGNHHPIGASDFARMPVKVQTSGGSTGLPRVTLFDPLSIEVQGIQTARGLYAQGARPGDIIQITYTMSLANAGWCALNGIFNWLGATPVTTGSGAVTPSERQLEYAQAWGTTGWFARGEYLARLVEVAREMKLDLHSLKTRQIHSFLGTDFEGHLRRQLEEAWGAPVYDNYGTHETGLLAFECRAQDRKHINEDTAFIELADVETGAPLSMGSRGNLVVTSLHRAVPPVIRYNLRDCLIAYEREECSCGLCTRKLSTFLGRSDEMVKLRGTNVYPLACQNAVTKDPRTTGEFLCVVSHVGEGLGRRETMVVRVERRSRDTDAQLLGADLGADLHKDLGVRVEVEIVESGTLAPYTMIGQQNKVKRLLDLRNKGTH